MGVFTGAGALRRPAVASRAYCVPARRKLRRLWQANAVLAAMLLAANPTHAGLIETYGRLPNLENISISPDGSKLAFIRTDENARMLAIVAIGDSKVLAVGRLGETKIRDISWADPTHLLITMSTTTLPLGFIGHDHEFFQLLVFDLQTHKVTLVPKLQDSGVNLLNVINGRPTVNQINGHTVLFFRGTWVSDMTLPAFIKYDINSHFQYVMRQGDTSTRDWLVDQAGDLVAEVDYYDHDNKWELKIRQDGHLRTVASDHSDIDWPDLLGLGPDGNSVLVSLMKDNHPAWKLVSIKDGTLTDPSEELLAPDRPLEDPLTHRMIGGVTLHDTASYAFFDSERRSDWRSLSNAYDEDQIELTSFTSDFKHVIVRITGPDGYGYRLVDLNTHRAIPLGDVYDGVKKAFETRALTYEAADGRKIRAYLTLPDRKPAEKLPLVVMPHGGPQARDSAEFDWWAQALASQGYAVLKPNFRGSSGSWESISAGFGQWGRKMQTDLSDGVRALAKQGTIDPARVCIVGASYGGYAALAGVTLDPGVYRCAVSVAGISDLKKFDQWVITDTRGHSSERYLERYLGASSPKDPSLDAISPILHIDNVNVPVLLIHGRDDTVVPFEQSELMFKALKRANKAVDLVIMKKEDHWLSRGETRLLMLQSSIAFLKANNPP